MLKTCSDIQNKNVNNGILKNIQYLENELKKVREELTYAIEDSGRDNNYVSPEVQELQLKINRIRIDINEKKKNEKRISLLQKKEDNSIDIGDVVRVNMIFDDDDVEEEIIKLVIGNPDIDSEIKEITIDSPMGAAMYGQMVETKTSYEVNGNEISLYIVEKIELNELQEANIGESQKVLTRKRV